jgi:hypothetical protein
VASFLERNFDGGGADKISLLLLEMDVTSTAGK